MIIGAFYWAFLFFGLVVVLLSVLGVLAQFQDHPLDLGSIVGAVAFGLFGAVIATYSGRALLSDKAGVVGARVGPEFQRTRIAGSGCLFVILVVGSALIVSGPMILLQLPGMAVEDRPAFGLGGAVGIFVGALLATPSGLLLWHRRNRSPGGAANRVIAGVVVGVLTVMVGIALLLASIFDPRYNIGPAAQLIIGAVVGVGVIAIVGFGVALRRRLR